MLAVSIVPSPRYVPPEPLRPCSQTTAVTSVTSQPAKDPRIRIDFVEAQGTDGCVVQTSGNQGVKLPSTICTIHTRVVPTYYLVIWI